MSQPILCKCQVVLFKRGFLTRVLDRLTTRDVLGVSIFFLGRTDAQTQTYCTDGNTVLDAKAIKIHS